MKKQFMIIAGSISFGACTMLAQGVGVGVGVGAGGGLGGGFGGGGGLGVTISDFQQASTIGTAPVRIFPFGSGAGLLTGSPLTAREVTKTTQTLSDGTVIE